VSAGGDERPGHTTRRPVIAGVRAPRGVRAGTDAGRTRAAEGHGRRLILCTQNRTDPISGFANNGDAPVSLYSGFQAPTGLKAGNASLPDTGTLNFPKVSSSCSRSPYGGLVTRPNCSPCDRIFASCSQARESADLTGLRQVGSGASAIRMGSCTHAVYEVGTVELFKSRGENISFCPRFSGTGVLEDWWGISLGRAQGWRVQ